MVDDWLMSRELEPPSNAVSGSVSGSVVQAGHITGVHVSGPPGRLPYRFGVAPRLAGAFQDRADLGVLNEVGPDDGVSTTVVSGLAGAGKTQVAVAAAECAWANGAIDLLVWINAASRDAIMTAYAALIADLTGISDTEPEVGARRLLAWLAETSARWLVVLDDLQVPSDLRGLWPPSASSGRVLVTTRRRDAALLGHRRRLVEVGLFTAAEAQSYLRSALAGAPELLDGAKELAADLGYLPLALAQAGAYLLDRHMSCAEYRRRFADQRYRLPYLPESDALPDEHQATVAATWSLSMERADRLSLGVARPLLEIASLLDGRGIPQELFATHAVLDLLTDRTGRTIAAGEARAGLAGLGRLGLVDLNQHAFVPLVLVHPLVQRATRDSLPEPRVAELARLAADGLLDLWPEIERDTPVGSVMRANASWLNRIAGDELWRDGIHPVLVRAGRSLGESGQAADAAAYFGQLAETAYTRTGPDHLGTLAIRAELATWRGEAGDVTGAVAELERLLGDRLRVLGPDHPDTLTTRNAIAYWRGEAGDVTGAVAELERLLGDRLRVLGPDHPNTLTTRNNLAQWRGEAGDPAGAAAALAELLADQRRVLGPDHPNTLTTRHNLAQWRGRAGDPAQAVAELEQLLPHQVRVLGPDHPGTYATHASLAQWLAYNGDSRHAANELERLLSGSRRTSDPGHPATLAMVTSLAAVYRQLGDYRRAQVLDAETFDRRRQRLGPDHPDTLLSATNLAVDLRHLGDCRRAQVLDAETFDRRRQRLGPDHPDTLLSATNLAVDLRQLGECDQALALDRQTARRRRQLRPEHPDTRRAERSVVIQETIGPLAIFVSYSARDTPAVGAMVDVLQANGMVVRTVRTSVDPGVKVGEAIERELDLADVVLAVLTDAGMPKAQQREIELALRRDALVIPVFVGSVPGEVAPGLPYGLIDRQGIRLDVTTPEALDVLATGVLRAVGARREPAVMSPTGVEVTGQAAVTAMVRDAFAAANRPLRVDDRVPGLLWPGPVWISDDAGPAELDRFARNLSHGQLGYFVHTAGLPRHARIALDEMRLSGTPVIAVSARSLRAAHADQRVDGFLTELERDYGNRDNLFDTKNALINERFLFGRDLLLNTIGSALRRDENVLITGLRKVGKTSLLNILRQRLVDRPVCSVDLQRFDRHREDWPRSLFSLMVAAFDSWGRAEHKDWPFTPSSPVTTTELEAALDSRRAHLRSQGRPTTSLVVILDELERVYPSPGEEHAARQWVRASGALRTLAQSDRRHVVIVGADLRPGVNRDNDLGPAGTNPFFAFFQETPVTLLDRDAVDRMVREIGQAMAIERINGDFVRELFELTGGHPSLIRTIAAEASRGRVHKQALTGRDLANGLDRLHSDDAIGFFLRNNLWQLMTTAEQAVVRNLALGRPIPAFVPTSAQREARSALRGQGLISDTVHIGLLRTWLRDEES